MKPTILTFVGAYLPGYKAGGPIRTIANMVGWLGDRFDFRIITSDRDVDDNSPYEGVRVNEWNQVGKARVFYLSPTRRNLRSIRRLISETEHDILYLNSVFSPTFSIMPLMLRRMKMISAKPCVIAPRGEFSLTAQSLKRWKKAPYLKWAKSIGIYDGLTWQASSPYEAEDIRRVMGRRADQIVVAPDLPSPTGPVEDQYSPRHGRPSGRLRVLFLSRISRMKNLDFSLRVLKLTTNKIDFDIYGPVEDVSYWKECQELIQTLPDNVRVSYHGPVVPARVPAVMAEHDVLFLPSRGENFGHVILEALRVGTPVLISDRTPWRNLADVGIGWDLPLSDKQAFADCLEQLAALSPEQYYDMRIRARQYASDYVNDTGQVKANENLFVQALQGSVTK